MPARARFTEERIEALPAAPAGKRTTYHDTEAPALKLRVTAEGAKSYYFVHRVRNGGMEWIHLGETPRVRVLGDDELKRFRTALQAEPNDVARDFFVVALLTGARRSNVLAMAWQDVDLKDRREHGDLHARVGAQHDQRSIGLSAARGRSGAGSGECSGRRHSRQGRGQEAQQGQVWRGCGRPAWAMTRSS